MALQRTWLCSKVQRQVPTNRAHACSADRLFTAKAQQKHCDAVQYKNGLLHLRWLFLTPPRCCGSEASPGAILFLCSRFDLRPFSPRLRPTALSRGSTTCLVSGHEKGMFTVCTASEGPIFFYHMASWSIGFTLSDFEAEYHESAAITFG